MQISSGFRGSKEALIDGFLNMRRFSKGDASRCAFWIWGEKEYPQRSDTGEGPLVFQGGACYSMFSHRRGEDEEGRELFLCIPPHRIRRGKDVTPSLFEPVAEHGLFSKDIFEDFVDWVLDKTVMGDAVSSRYGTGLPCVLEMNVDADRWLLHHTCTTLRIPDEHPAVVYRWAALVALGLDRKLAYIIALSFSKVNSSSVWESAMGFSAPVTHSAISDGSVGSMRGFLLQTARKGGQSWRKTGAYRGHGSMWKQKDYLGTTSFSRLLSESPDTKTTPVSDFAAGSKYLNWESYCLRRFGEYVKEVVIPEMGVRYVEEEDKYVECDHS